MANYDTHFEQASSFAWTPVGGGYHCCICMRNTPAIEACFANNGGTLQARLEGCMDDKYHKYEWLNCAVCNSCAKRLGVTW